MNLTETDENEVLEKEVNKRRQRLGSAGPEELRKQVGLEIWGSSKVPKSTIPQYKTRLSTLLH